MPNNAGFNLRHERSRHAFDTDFPFIHMLAMPDRTVRIFNYTSVELGMVRLVQFDIDGVERASRTPAHIRTDQLDDIVFVVPLNSNYSDVRLSQAGTSTQLAPGAMTLFSTAKPVDISLHTGAGQQARFSEMMVVIPREQLCRRVPNVEESCGAAFDMRLGMGRIVRSLLQQGIVDSPYLSVHQAQQIGETITGLMADTIGAYAARGLGENAPPARRRIEELAERFIRQNLSNPELSVDQVADHCHVSKRYLQMAFESRSTTVSALIREIRLDCCRAELRNPAFGGFSLTEIAMKWGFGDMAHFSKTYRARFNGSPSEERKHSVLLLADDRRIS